MVHQESSGCNHYAPYIEDGNVFAELQFSNSDYKSLLKVLYWRSRQQIAVWEIFFILCERRFLTCEASLRESIDFGESIEAINTIARYLDCFDFVIREKKTSSPPFKNWQNTEASMN